MSDEPTFVQSSTDIGIVSLLRLISHDLRTPLNVIGLALRVIAESEAGGIENEIAIAEEGVRAIADAISILSELARTLEPPGEKPALVSGKAVAESLLAEFPPGLIRLDDDGSPVSLAAAESSLRAALRAAFANAVRSAAGEPVTATARQAAEAWTITIENAESPGPRPRPSRKTSAGWPTRILGVRGDRFGLDLWVARRALALSGGTLELDQSDEKSALAIRFPVSPA